MDIVEKLSFVKGTIYHEIGHLTGYCLANSNTSTYLGEVKTVQLGVNNNFVIPSSSYYHSKPGDSFEEILKLGEATLEVRRTIAWFIEVLAGCTFETLYENKGFRTCFGHGKETYSGHIDWSNLNWVSKVSKFSWELEELFELQKEFAEIIEDDNFIEKIEPLIFELLLKIKHNPNNQLELTGNEVLNLNNVLNILISQSMKDNYQSIIQSYEDRFRLRITST